MAHRVVNIDEAGKLIPVLPSPQFDHPVKNSEYKESKEQHVAVDFGLASSGQKLQSAHGGSQQTTS